MTKWGYSAIGWRVLVVAMVSSGLAGCAGFLPIAGPSSEAVNGGESTSTVPYALIPLTGPIADLLNQYESTGLAGTFTDRRPPQDIKFGIGDLVSVTIFEAAAGGLFIPIEAGVRPGNFVSLPDQAVDNNGNISVPFAGPIKAAGRVNTQIQAEIVDKIKNRAIEPQVIVSLSQQRTALVSVLGEVNTPVRFAAAATGAGDRITDALTRAGGIRDQGWETWVVLERGGKRATVPFRNLILHPENNIYVLPGDRIYVYREQQKFIAFGASGAQGEFNFDDWHISLAEAVAKAGGLNDGLSDPGSVFLYRREPREVLKKMGVDISRFETETVPVIFSVSFRDPGGYFVATKVDMHNDDVIYVANADAVQVTKFLNVLNLGLNTVNNALSVPSNGAILKFDLSHHNYSATPVAPSP